MNRKDPTPAHRVVGLWGLLLPGVVAAAMTFTIAGALFVAPASPLVLGRADATLGQGDAASAVEQLMGVARTSPDPDLQRQALERAAQVYALELDDPSRARSALKLLLAMGTEPAEEARLRARIAELMLQERDVAAAAAQYKRAWLADKQRPELLSRAANLEASIGNIDKARSHFRTLLAEAPAWTARANLGLGAVALHDGNATAALRPFQKALRSGTPEVQAAARLGLAACYERLGELDGALAEIEQSDLPPTVRARRTEAIRKRADDFRN